MRGTNFDVSELKLCTESLFATSMDKLCRIIGLYSCFSCNRQLFTLCGTCAARLCLTPSTCLICQKSSECGAVHSGCTPYPLYYDSSLALFSYTKVVKKLFSVYKFHSAFQYQRIIEKLVAEYVALDPFLLIRKLFSLKEAAMPIKIALVPIPMTKHKESERGFSPAREIATIFGRQLLKLGAAQVRLFPTLLIKTKETPAQSHKKRHERLLSLQKAYSSNKACYESLLRYNPTHLIIIDDVLTTGSTANVALEALVADAEVRPLLKMTRKILFTFARAELRN